MSSLPSSITTTARNLLLGGVYLFVIAPIGLVVRRFRDPLNRAWDRDATTYRVPATGADRANLERMSL
jgi:hypothetical protein